MLIETRISEFTDPSSVNQNFEFIDLFRAVRNPVRCLSTRRKPILSKQINKQGVEIKISKSKAARLSEKFSKLRTLGNSTTVTFSNCPCTQKNIIRTFKYTIENGATPSDQSTVLVGQLK